MSFAVSISDCADAVAGTAPLHVKASAASRSSCTVLKLQPL
jgi:hypothetical protein